MCYCDKDEMEILEDIRNRNIPEEALVRNCCWSQVCRIRGNAPGFVSSDTWSEICRQRGYLSSQIH